MSNGTSSGISSGSGSSTVPLEYIVTLENQSQSIPKCQPKRHNFKVPLTLPLGVFMALYCAFRDTDTILDSQPGNIEYRFESYYF